MEKKHVYPLKLNKWVYLLIPAVVLLTIPVIIMNIIRITNMAGTAEGYNMVLDIVVIILSVAIFALSMSAILCARYAIRKHCLYCSLGIFTSRIKISHIIGITHFTHLDKLAVFYQNGNFVKQIVVSIAEEQYDDFIDTLRKENPRIPYDVDSDDYDEK